MAAALTAWTVHLVFVVVLGFTVFVSQRRVPALFCGAASPDESSSSSKASAPAPVPGGGDQFRRFQRLYLVCVLICLAGDWLQGPYMYALYDAYGFEHDEIAALFVAGFGSSCVFGTFVGSLADTIGRKRGALLYVLTYVLSCATKHWNSYAVLMVGRVLGGVSTSLLFSVFDSWVVSEHARRGFDPALLSTLFANVQAGNSAVAIAAGVVGEWAARLWPMRTARGGRHLPLEKNDGSIVFGGFCTPFDVAAVVLLVGGAAVSWTWTENYGAAGQGGGVQGTGSVVLASLKAGTATVFRDKKVLLVGLISALFEAAMYSFVFEWTPAVKASPTDRPPYGEIFSIMMLACAAGTRVYAARLAPAAGSASNANVTLVFAAASVALFVPSTIESPFLCLVAFLVFEVSVGIYFPAIAVLKSKLIPDAHRSTIYNLFRVPLNVLVLAVLLSRAPGKVIFAASACLVALAAIAHFDLHRRLAQRDDYKGQDLEADSFSDQGDASSSAKEGTQRLLDDDSNATTAYDHHQ